MVDGVRRTTAVLRQVGIGDDVRAGRDLADEPVAQRVGGGDLAGDPQPVHDGALVMALRVGEVPEVQGGMLGGIGSAQPHAAGGAGARHVRCHAHSVLRHGVAQTFGVDGERHLVEVEHQVGARLVLVAAQEQPGVGVHRGVGRQRARGLPEDHRLGVVQQVFPYAGQVGVHGDAQGAQVVGRADTGQHQQARGVDGSGAQQEFTLGAYGGRLAVGAAHGDAGRPPRLVGEESVGPGLQQEREVGPVQDGVEVGDGGGGAQVALRLVGQREESGAVREGFGVEIVDDGDVEGAGGRGDEVLGDRIAVGLRHRDDLGQQPLPVREDRRRVPPGTAPAHPVVEVLRQRQEADQRVVGGTAAEHAGT